MIDTHTHIFDKQFDDDRQQALERAVEQGVQYFILPATMDNEHERLFEVCATSDRYFATMGLHPIAANDNPNWREHLAHVERLLQNPPVPFVAIGETGLDLHWSQNYLEEQKAIFVSQIELSITHDLPLVIHTRDAWHELLPIMERYAGQIRGVFHSFVGTVAEIERIEAMGGFMYGINGTVTYRKSVLPEALKYIGLDRIVLETDSPYLPPEPHRGRRNESSYVPLVALKVAEIKGVSLDDIDKITTKNAIEMFKVSPFLNVKNNI